MSKQIFDAARAALVFSIPLILLLQTGCTRSEINSRPVVDPGLTEAAEAESPPPVQETAAERDEVPYNIEDELEEDGSDEETRVDEEFVPIRSDSFTIKDVSPAPEHTAGYGIGFRIQLLASADLNKARELKKIVMAGTGLAVYIEFEDGLYKVRAGDFPTRDEAAGVRTGLAESYPDCWIVQTTIVK